MNTERHPNDSGPAATVNQIACAAREGEMTRQRFAGILQGRHGAVNCYPGEPTNACSPLAYVLALEGPLGQRIRSELADREWEPPVLRWRHRPWRVWDAPARQEEPRFTFAWMLDRVIRHLQGSCAGTTHEGVPITDTWDACRPRQTTAGAPISRRSARRQPWRST